MIRGDGPPQIEGRRNPHAQPGKFGRISNSLGASVVAEGPAAEAEKEARLKPKPRPQPKGNWIRSTPNI